MMGLPLAFTVPVVLAALAALPVLYWLLRMTPPPPNRAVLPTLPLVRDLDPREETPARTPWWLLLLRLLLAALVILAMAGPLWNPDPEARVGRGPLLIVIDDSWSAAPDWKLRTERAAALMESAGASGRAVALRPVSADPVDIVPGAAARALDQLRSLQPRPHSLDRKRQDAPVRAFAERNAEGAVAWIADGVSILEDRDAISRLAEVLGERLVVYAAEQPIAFGLAQPLNQPDALTVRVLRAAASGQPAVALRALDAKGRAVAEGSARFTADALETLARIEAPLEIRNDIARIDIVGHASAGAVTLLDGRNKRRRVGIVSGETVDTAQPLLSSQYFISRALGPYADVREAPRGAPDPVGRLIEDGARAIILADVGTIAGPTLQKLTEFVDAGGVLIRFASRRVAAPTDRLLPVRLRRSERVMGGALSWDTPRKLASFSVEGPFGGLSVPADVTVTQQVLAEPEATLTEKTWAALEDGTPLITGERRGKGVVALFHVTADTGWSSLPLSAAFVETLRRLSALASTDAEAAPGETPPAEGTARAAATLAPLRQLDGFGTFQPPAATTEPAPRNFAEPASARHPPGFYGTADAPLAINTLGPRATLAALDLTGVGARALVARPATDLRPHLLTLALVLFLADALASLWLSGALARLRRRAAIAALLAATLLLPLTDIVMAQPAPTPADRLPSFRADDVESSLITRLGYVITGDREVDEISRQGLQGLSRALGSRTALDPGEPIGVDPARDELAFYPLLYWPMTPNRPAPSDAAIRRIDAYMKNGGTILFDTRDAQVSRGPEAVTPETRLLRQILAGIDVPDLEAVPKDHVITKTFYILDSFVGRHVAGRTWIETLQRSQDQDRTRPAQAGDRVSPIIITGNDLAAAWAVDRLGQPRFPLVPGAPRQREMAIRGGVNIVMYAMTGNYKADQVHVPALLERLGQ